MTYYINLRPASPVSRFVGALLAVLVVVAAVFFGLIVLAFIFGAGVLLSLGLWIRSRILSSRMGGRTDSTVRVDTQTRGSETIEAEYTVISKRRD